MTQTAKAQEPSMEEILDSIRRIIADDDASKPAKTPEPAAAPAKPQPAAAAAPRPAAPPAPPPAKPAAPPPPEPPKPAASAPATPPPGPAPSFRTIDAASDVVFANKLPEFPPDRALISNATVAAVDSAFNTLAHTVIGQNARTLEDLVREMLRPLLKSWLDDNLPSMVERIVRAEIERVSRGRP